MSSLQKSKLLVGFDLAPVAHLLNARESPSLEFVETEPEFSANMVIEFPKVAGGKVGRHLQQVGERFTQTGESTGERMRGFSRLADSSS
jgi:hypothetical protein